MPDDKFSTALEKGQKLFYRLCDIFVPLAVPFVNWRKRTGMMTWEAVNPDLGGMRPLPPVLGGRLKELLQLGEEIWEIGTSLV